MNLQIERIRKTRQYLLDQIRPLSTEQWNLVPHGFNNNIVWNIGHMIAVQQGICYVRAGIPTHIEEAFFNFYKPGTKPSQFVGPEEIEMIKDLLFSTLLLLENDVTENRFTGYQPWPTRYGVEIKSIQEALAFLLYHEGLHGGIVTAMRHIVTH